MNTKSLNKIKKALTVPDFDLEFEAQMVQSRLLSPLIEIMEEKRITQSELAKKTGLSQPFINGLLHLHKKLNMEHIALIQKALGVVLQPPEALTEEAHRKKFYEEYEPLPEKNLFTFDEENLRKIFEKNYSLDNENYTIISERQPVYDFSRKTENKAYSNYL